MCARTPFATSPGRAFFDQIVQAESYANLIGRAWAEQNVALGCSKGSSGDQEKGGLVESCEVKKE